MELDVRDRKALVSLIFCALLVPIAPVWADSPAQELNSENYQSGRDLCRQEPGAWVRVPYSYNLTLDAVTEKYELTEELSQGEEEIFYRVYSDGQNIGPFLRPGKPSILYFEGGPGGVASTRADFFKAQSAALDVNIITFEVRGVSCSRPESFDRYIDPSFYSGLYLAADAKKIVDQLGLQEVLVYGLSYGTFPARLFAYFYPEKTKAVLLEGTLTLDRQQRADGSPLLESLKRLYSEQFFNSPSVVLQFFSYMAQKPAFQPWMDTYLYNLSKVASYFGARGIEKYYYDLTSRSDDWEEFSKLMTRYPVASPWRSATGPGQEDNIDFAVFEMYLCRDFDRTLSLSSSPITINSSGQIMVKENGGYNSEWSQYLATTCLAHRRPREQSFEAILSHHGGMLPLEDPVLILNGGLDFITPSYAAQKEAERIGTDKLTFLEFGQEGHAPWNLIHLYGTPEQKLFLENLLKNWTASGEVDLSLEDFEFMQSAHIKSTFISH